MTLSLDDVLVPDSADTLLTFLFTQLAAPPRKWPVTNWSKFGAGYPLLKTFAAAGADFGSLIRQVAAGGLLEYATGEWLTLLAKNAYGLDRTAAVFARPYVKLTCSALNGPYTITPAQLRFRLADGRTYQSANTANVALAAGGTAELDFIAAATGEAYNVEIADEITPVTILVGVTWEFEETETSSGTAMSVQGSDEEDDDDLKERCRGRWSSLGVEKTYLAYEYLARNVPAILANVDGDFSQITRVLVDDTNPDGPGTVRIYLAGEAGAIAGDTLTEADEYLQSRKGLCAVLATQGSIDVAVSVEALVQCAEAHVDAAIEAIEAGLEAYNASLPIGDGAVSNPTGVIQRAQVVEILMAPEGVTNVVLDTVLLNGAAFDYTPSKGNLGQMTISVGIYGSSADIQVQGI
jgi:hypothetical protein